MGKFELKQRTNGEFQFNLKADNGQIILTSESYTSKEACKNGIKSVKKHAENEKWFKQSEAKNGKYYFNLTASNYQIIGASQMYKSKSSANSGIMSVMKNAPSAMIDDRTK